MKKIAVQKTTTIDLCGTLTDALVILINGNVSKIFLPGQVNEYVNYVQVLTGLGYELKVEEE